MMASAWMHAVASVKATYSLSTQYFKWLMAVGECCNILLKCLLCLETLYTLTEQNCKTLLFLPLFHKLNSKI